ncbi:hypothetical protein AGMMS50293_03310 [Spirochaetia bacterium]|nr:hypothetical protein AGMMS50293_03310 [Spirochaetia bacterium]
MKKGWGKVKMKKILSKIIRRIDRAIAGTIGAQLFIFALAVVSLFIILFVVSAVLYPAEGGIDVRFWTVMNNFLDVGGYEETSGVSPILIFIVNICGMVFMGGLLVSVLTNIITRRIERVQEGEVYYQFKEHVIIIGYDKICAGLIAGLVDKGCKEIVLQTVRNVPEVHHELFTELSKELYRKTTIVSGNRTSAEDIKKLCLCACTEIFLFGEQGEDDRDSRNIECLKLLASELSGANKNVRCHVLFSRQSTFVAFQQQDIPEIREHIDFIPFNFCDHWAKKVFADCEYGVDGITYTPLDREPITDDSEKQVHLVILGMTSMGIALGMQAAQLCHFPNFFTKGIKTRITFIDEKAKKEMDFLKGRVRSLFDEIDYFYWDVDSCIKTDNTKTKEKFTDFEFEFICGRFECDEIQMYLAELAGRKNTFLTIAAALKDSSALATALYLPSAVYESETQILVNQEASYAVVDFLSQKAPDGVYRKYRNLRPFGMLSGAYNAGEADDLIPMMIKYIYDEANKGSSAQDFPIEQIRKSWLLDWKPSDTVSALKASNRYCANSIPIKQRSLGIRAGVELTEQQIKSAALVEHNRWTAEKLLLGFRAPTAEETASIAAENKRDYFKQRLIHADIKAYAGLGLDDKNIDVKVYDINICRAIPYMLEVHESMNKRSKQK